MVRGGTEGARAVLLYGQRKCVGLNTEKVGIERQQSNWDSEVRVEEKMGIASNRWHGSALARAQAFLAGVELTDVIFLDFALSLRHNGARPGLLYVGLPFVAYRFLLDQLREGMGFWCGQVPVIQQGERSFILWEASSFWYWEEGFWQKYANRLYAVRNKSSLKDRSHESNNQKIPLHAIINHTTFSTIPQGAGWGIG